MSAFLKTVKQIQIIGLLAIMTLSPAWAQSPYGPNGPGGVGDGDGNEPLYWLIADDITSANGTEISTWPNHNVAAGTADFVSVGGQTLPEVKTNAINGHNAILFNDATDQLITENTVDIYSNGAMIYMVAKSDLSSMSNMLAFSESTGSDMAYLELNTSGGTNFKTDKSGGGYNSSLSGDPLQSGQTISSDYELLQIRILKISGFYDVGVSIDGVLVSTDKLTLEGLADNIDEILLQWDSEAEIAELIVTDANIYDVETTIIQNYLSSKYDISMTTNDYFTHDGSGDDYSIDVAGIRSDGTDLHGEAYSDILKLKQNGGSGSHYTFFGHDNGSLAFQTDENNIGYMYTARSWRIDDVGNHFVKFKVDVSGLEPIETYQKYALFVDDNSDFSSPSVYILDGNNEYSAGSGLNLVDNNYIKIGAVYYFECENSGYTEDIVGSASAGQVSSSIISAANDNYYNNGEMFVMGHDDQGTITSGEFQFDDPQTLPNTTKIGRNWCFEVTEGGIDVGEGTPVGETVNFTIDGTQLDPKMFYEKYVLFITSDGDCSGPETKVAVLTQNGTNYEGQVRFEPGTHFISIGKLYVDYEPAYTAGYNDVYGVHSSCPEYGTCWNDYAVYTIGRADINWNVDEIAMPGDSPNSPIEKFGYTNDDQEVGDYLAFGYKKFFSGGLEYGEYNYYLAYGEWFIDHTSNSTTPKDIFFHLDKTRMDGWHTLVNDEQFAIFLDEDGVWGPGTRVFTVGESGSFYVTNDVPVDKDYYIKVGYINTIPPTGFTTDIDFGGHSDNIDEWCGVDDNIVTSDLLTLTKDIDEENVFFVLGHDNVAGLATPSGNFANTVTVQQKWAVDLDGASKAVFDISRDASNYAGLGTMQGYQEYAFIIDDDGDFSSGNTRIVVNENTGSSNRIVYDLELSDQERIRYAYLHNYAYIGSYSGEVKSMGRAYKGYNETGLETSLLEISNPEHLDINDYLIFGHNSGSTDITNTLGDHTLMSRHWRANIYGDPGTVDVTFDITGLTLPSGKSWVMMVDRDGDGNFSNADSYLMHPYTNDAIAFSTTINDGDVITFGYTDYTLTSAIDTRVVFSGFDGSLSSSTTKTLYTQNNESSTPNDPCFDEIKSAMVYLTLNTGADYNFGNNTFEREVTVDIIGYSHFTSTSGGDEVFKKEDVVLTIDQDNPEQVYTYPITSYYGDLKRIDVNITGYTTSGITEVEDYLQLTPEVIKEERTRIPRGSTALLETSAVTLENNSLGLFEWDWPTTMDEMCTAPLYQFQLLKLYNVDPTKTSYDHTITAEVNWDQALTLETPNKSISLTLAEGTGHYLWRVRPIGDFYDGGVADSRNWGAWTDAPANGSLELTDASSLDGQFHYSQFDEGKSFIFSRTFAENARVGESLSYANGLQQTTQSQSHFLPDESHLGPELCDLSDFSKTFGAVNDDYVSSEENYNFKVGKSRSFKVTGKIRRSDDIDGIVFLMNHSTDEMSDKDDDDGTVSENIDPTNNDEWEKFEVTLTIPATANYYFYGVYAEDMSSISGITVDVEDLSIREIIDGQPIVVGGTVRDYSGRASLVAMSAPVVEKYGFSYEEDLLKDNFGALYTAKNFDENDNYNDPDPMGGGIVNDYWSHKNEDLSVPSADGFPFSRTIFHTDGTDRPKESGSVGSTLRLKPTDKHTVRVNFASVSDDELIRVFGDEAPDARSVHKTITTDQNNIQSVTYTNKAGETIATCMIKNNATLYPTNLELLESDADDPFSVNDELNQNISTTNGGLHSTKTYFFTEPTDLHIEQELTPTVFNSMCGDYCATCGYNVTFIITEDGEYSGEDCESVDSWTITTSYSGSVSPGSSCSATSDGFDIYFDGVTVSDDTETYPQLAAGSYTVQRIIELDPTVAQDYVDDVADALTTELEAILADVQTEITAGDAQGILDEIVDVINNEGTTYYATVRDESDAAVALSLPITEDDLEDGWILNVATASGCCDMDLPIHFPEYSLVDDIATDPGEYFVAQYKAQNNNTWDLDYTENEFETLIDNMLAETGAMEYELGDLEQCWDGVLVTQQAFNLMANGQDPDGNTLSPTLQSMIGTGLSNVPDAPDWTSEVGTSISTDLQGAIDPVQQFLGCAGTKYVGFTTNATLLKTKAYKYFEYTSGDNGDCEDAICNHGPIDLENDELPEDENDIPAWVCDPEACSLTLNSNSPETNANGFTFTSGSTAWTTIEYDALKSCSASNMSDVVTTNPPDYASTKADMEAAAEEIEAECQSACDKKYDGFLADLLELYDDGMGGYLNSKVYEDLCCMAEGLVEECRNSCSLDILEEDCSGTDVLVSLGTKDQVATIAAIMGGSYELQMTSGGTCGAGFDKITNSQTESTGHCGDNETIEFDWKVACSFTDGGYTPWTKTRVLGASDYVYISEVQFNSGYYDHYLHIYNDSDGSELSISPITVLTGASAIGSRIIDEGDGVLVVQGKSNQLHLVHYDYDGTYISTDVVTLSEDIQSLPIFDCSEKDGFLYLTFPYNDNVHSVDGTLIAKIDFSGNEEFANVFDYGSTFGSNNSIIRVGNSGNIFIASSYDDDLNILKLDPDGDVIDFATFELYNTIGSSYFDFEIDNQGSIQVSYYAPASGCQDDIQIVTISNSLVLGDTKTIGTVVEDVNWNIDLDSNGDLILPFFSNTDTDNIDEDFICSDDVTSTPSSYYNIGIAKSDIYHNIEYSYLYEETSGHMYTAWSNVTPDDEIIVVGYQSNDYTIYKFHIDRTAACSPDDICLKWIGTPDDIDVNVVLTIPDPPTVNEFNETELQDAITSQIDKCVTKKRAELRNEYFSQCLGSDINETTTANYDLPYHHYTLYYYDRSGNLVQTVPPAGVDASVANRSTHPSHTMKTTYRYNSLGQLIEQKLADATDDNEFIYNTNGQLRFSQSPRQALDGTYSYMKYDNLSRIIEVGQSSLTLGQFTDLQNPTYSDDLSYPAANNEEITYTVYNDAQSVQYHAVDYGLSTVTMKDQRYLRNRITHAYTDDDGNPATTNDQVHTYFSYDPHGNVEWVIQDVPGIGQHQTGYEYDLISGNVLKIKYNEGYLDQFYHRYTYDAGNRIELVETSSNSITWDKEARYDYSIHGTLQRTILGEDRVQGTDMTYTNQGWLKGKNHYMLDGSVDPSKDGIGKGFYGTVANDDYAMALTYFDGDFYRYYDSNDDGDFDDGIDPESVFNTDYDDGTFTSGHLSANSKDLYNGNIAAWTNNYTQADDAKYNGTASKGFNNRYTYDALNRILNADYMMWDASSEAFTNPASKVFDAEFTYEDANGNLGSIKRYNSSGQLQENLTYSYTGGTNRLEFVNDNDDDDGQGSLVHNPLSHGIHNYTYDADGNLISESHMEDGANSIEWTAYGKVRKITNPDGTTIEFRYDAGGNRVQKTVVAPASQPHNTWYILEAGGNPVAVYEKQENSEAIVLTEQAIYGSDRLGLHTPNLVISRSESAWVYNAERDTDIQSGNSYTLSTGETGYVLSATNYTSGTLTVDGGTLVIDGTADNVVFNSGVLIVKGTLNNSSLSVPASSLVENYGTTNITTELEVLSGGGFDNLGTLNVEGTVIGQVKNCEDVVELGEGDYTDDADIDCFESAILVHLPANIAYNTRGIGQRSYELKDHLGNVRVVITDRKYVNLSTEEYTTEVVSFTDYWPFGAPNLEREETSYRYGFQGQEKDDEIHGEGNSISYKYRIHDARIGRFMSVDPLYAAYPFNSQYSFSENSVIAFVELEGLEKMYYLDAALAQNLKTQLDNGDDAIVREWLANGYLDEFYKGIGHGDVEDIFFYNKDADGSYGEQFYIGKIRTLKGVKADAKVAEERKAADLRHKKFLEDEKNRRWYHDLYDAVLAPGALEGNNDGLNGGGVNARDIKYAVTAISAIITIGTGGVSLIAEGVTLSWGSGLTIAGMANSFDDLSGLASSDGKTVLQNLVGEDIANVFKLGLNFAGSKKALIDYTNSLDDATKSSLSIISFVNDQGNTYYGLFNMSEATKKDDKTTK